jgi:ABC-type dipeptide/oligopeptide/nickel transport system ATPase subunit
MLKLDSLTIITREGKKILDEVSLEIHPNEIVGLVGGSGSGKSTIFQAIFSTRRNFGASQNPGLSWLWGKNSEIPGKGIVPVFQDAFGSFNPNHTILHSLHEPAVILKEDLKEWDERIQTYLPILDMNLQDLLKYPEEFSGGQMQRLAILRAVLQKPEYLIMDEPVSGLDYIVRRSVIRLLLDLKKVLGFGVLFISHDLEVVIEIADRIYVLDRGKVIEEGSRGKIPNSNSQPYTKELFNPWEDSEDSQNAKMN